MRLRKMYINNCAVKNKEIALTFELLLIVRIRIFNTINFILLKSPQSSYILNQHTMFVVLRAQQYFFNYIKLNLREHRNCVPITICYSN